MEFCRVKVGHMCSWNWALETNLTVSKVSSRKTWRFWTDTHQTFLHISCGSTYLRQRNRGLTQLAKSASCLVPNWRVLSPLMHFKFWKERVRIRHCCTQAVSFRIIPAFHYYLWYKKVNGRKYLYNLQISAYDWICYF